MKLLLTSAGFTNQSIIDAFADMLGKDFSDATLAIIPTANNVSKSDKVWFVDTLADAATLNFKMLDFVDISAIPRDMWEPRLRQADALFFTGGHSAYLMKWIRESGLIDILPELLETKVFMGNSAGSIVACPDLALDNQKKRVAHTEYWGKEEFAALNYVDFYLRPHIGAPTSPHATYEAVEEFAITTDRVVYALDDASAIAVVDDQVTVISEGDYKIFNQ